MENQATKNPVEFTDALRKLKTTDRAHAKVFNALFEVLINNDVFLKTFLEEVKKKSEEHIEDSVTYIKKLDGIAAGAQVNQFAFSKIVIGELKVSANGETATLTIQAGDNVTISADNATKKIVISANKDGGNADKLDGYHAEHFATTGHGHDGRYYTKTESDNLLNGKANSNHNHNSVYYTKTEINNTLSGKAAADHGHDGRYYTKTESDNLLNQKAASNHNHNGGKYLAGQGTNGGYSFINDGAYDTGMFSDVDGDLYFMQNGEKWYASHDGHNHNELYYTKEELQNVGLENNNCGSTEWTPFNITKNTPVTFYTNWTINNENSIPAIYCSALVIPGLDTSYKFGLVISENDMWQSFFRVNDTGITERKYKKILNESNFGNYAVPNDHNIVRAGAKELALMDRYFLTNSFIGSTYDGGGNTWYDLINVRHRGGASDGDCYGMQIYSKMTETSDLKWRQQFSASYMEIERTLLDTANYTKYIKELYLKKLTLWDNNYNVCISSSISDNVSNKSEGCVIIGDESCWCMDSTDENITVEVTNLTAIGYGALRFLGDGHYIGSQDDTAIGAYAGYNFKEYSPSTDDFLTYNTFIGSHSGSDMYYGSDCTFLGYCSGGSFSSNGSNRDTSMYNCTFLGNNTGIVTDSSMIENVTVIGEGARATGDNQLQLGSSGTSVYAWSALNNRSDARDKADVRDAQLGLEFLLKHRPVEFRWDRRDDYFEEKRVNVEKVRKIKDKETGEIKEKTYTETEIQRVPIPKDGSKKCKRFHEGFIAQEVKAIMDEMGVDFAGYQDHSHNGGADVLTLGYTEYIPIVVKAIQELKQMYDAEIRGLKEEISALKNQK